MTRIPRTMLANLEKNRFDEFTAEVFVRGHLRNYTRELRLDVEDVMQAYEKHTGKCAAVPPGPEASGVSSSEEPGDSEPPTQRLEAATLPGRFSELTIGPTQMLAIALVLVGIVVFVSLLSGNRATAEDPAQFPEAGEEQWEIEKDARETRWLLEQPASEPATPDE